MGDRSNVLFKRRGKPFVAFYSHWSGRGLHAAALKIFAESKAAQGRADDPSYFTRIMIQSLMESEGSKSNDETGFGIAADELPDNSYKLLVFWWDDFRSKAKPFYVAEKEIDRIDELAKKAIRADSRITESE